MTWASLAEPLVERRRLSPEATALVFWGEDGSRETLSVARLDDTGRTWASALAASGICADDVVLLVMGHSLDLVSAFLGAQYLGAVPSVCPYPTPKMDAALYARRLHEVVVEARPRAIVTSEALKPILGPLLAGLDCAMLSPADLPLETASPCEPAPAVPGRRAFLQFTSGTTGAPKGIGHTHVRVLDYVLRTREPWDRLTTDDVIVSWLPLYHDLGLVGGLLTPLVTGVPSVLLSPIAWVRDPVLFLRAIHEHRGTLAWMPNFALNLLVRGVREQDLAGLDLSTLRVFVLGGEPVREASIRAFVERFAPHGFREDALGAGYGMAEMIEAATTTVRGRRPAVDWVSQRALAAGRAEPAAAGAEGATSFVSVGPPIARAEVYIAGEDGRPLPERRVGEVIVRSPYMFEGYEGRPELTAQALHGGWFHTGDLGYLAGGELYVCGRRSDVIIVGGHNLHPEEIEAVAGGVPGIHPGRVVAFGVADDRIGTERVVLLWEGDETAAPTVGHEVRRRMLAALDVALGDVRVVPRGWILKTSNGKLARPANRQKYAAAFG